MSLPRTGRQFDSDHLLIMMEIIGGIILGLCIVGLVQHFTDMAYNDPIIKRIVDSFKD